MRSQAVAPTTMDPNSANACCHAGEGTPSCARPSVSIYPTQAAGTAKRSAMAVRILGDRFVSIAACPTPHGEAPSDRGDDDGSEYTSAAVVGRKACGNADNRWQRVHYEIKQRPA
jgi:hypothetical protein